MLEETLREKSLFGTFPFVRYLAAGFFAAGLYAGCGEESEPACRTDRDCLRSCINNIDCNYINPLPGQVEQCRELRVQECYRNVRCGRYCGEREVERCSDEDNLVCERVKEPYCENSCYPNQ